MLVLLFVHPFIIFICISSRSEALRVLQYNALSSDSRVLFGIESSPISSTFTSDTTSSKFFKDKAYDKHLIYESVPTALTISPYS